MNCYHSVLYLLLKKRKAKMKICFLIFALNLASEVFPADTASVKYFPLKAGNTWYYKTTYSPIPFPPYFHKDYIEKDTSINGITYFKFYKYGSVSFIRVDSVKGNLLAYSPLLHYNSPLLHRLPPLLHCLSPFIHCLPPLLH